MVHPDEHEIEEVRKYNQSKWFTLGWGLFCIAVAQFSSRLGSLIEAVNIYGSIFYGVILGIFLVAFYMKKVGGQSVFWASIVSELGVISLFILDNKGIVGIGFLWLTVVGTLGVILLSWLLNFLFGENKKSPSAAKEDSLLTEKNSF